MDDIGDCIDGVLHGRFGEKRDMGFWSMESPLVEDGGGVSLLMYGEMSR